ncbi:hypothetical protein LZ30DRAFT_419786 [Colletotrichum cereale]|nr:hypothetical protein LZ30DRAFT_419786 [Colletotrichum cereale]
MTLVVSRSGGVRCDDLDLCLSLLDLDSISTPGSEHDVPMDSQWQTVQQLPNPSPVMEHRLFLSILHLTSPPSTSPPCHRTDIPRFSSDRLPKRCTQPVTDPQHGTAAPRDGMNSWLAQQRAAYASSSPCHVDAHPENNPAEERVPHRFYPPAPPTPKRLRPWPAWLPRRITPAGKG